MDVEFIVQDAYALVRPQWKLITDLDEASRVFGEAVKQNYQPTAADKPTEPEDEDESASDDDVDGPEDDDVVVPEGDDKSSDEDEGVCMLFISDVQSILTRYRTPMRTSLSNPCLMTRKSTLS